MLLNKLVINEYSRDKNCNALVLNYEGNKKDNDLDDKKTLELVNKFMHQLTYHGDMVKNLRFLRTILKDYDEKVLELNYFGRDVIETVKYINKNINYFERKENYFDDEYFIINYSPFSNINFSFTDYDDKLVKESNIRIISNNLSNNLRKIEALKNISIMELDRDSKMIIQIYKLFYKENPDFSDKNINIRIQAMISLLMGFGISIDDYCYFSVDDRGMPVSLKLLSVVNNLFPFGEVKDIDNPILFKEDYEKRISIIGEEVGNLLLRVDDKEGLLINISKLINGSGIHFNNVDKLLELTDISIGDVELGIKLVKKINNKILKV